MEEPTHECIGIIGEDGRFNAFFDKEQNSFILRSPTFKAHSS